VQRQGGGEARSSAPHTSTTTAYRPRLDWTFFSPPFPGGCRGGRLDDSTGCASGCLPAPLPSLFSAAFPFTPRPSPLLSPAYPFRPASPPPTIEVLPTLLSSLHRLARGLDLGFLSVSRVDPVGGALGALVGGWVSEGEGILGLARV
jgi:hypothetical protein